MGGPTFSVALVAVEVEVGMKIVWVSVVAAVDMVVVVRADDTVDEGWSGVEVEGGVLDFLRVSVGEEQVFHEEVAEDSNEAEAVVYHVVGELV